MDDLALLVIFRCASISWIHVGESVSESLIHVFEILSNLGHMRAWVDMSVRVCADVHMCMLESIEYFLEIK